MGGNRLSLDPQKLRELNDSIKALAQAVKTQTQATTASTMVTAGTQSHSMGGYAAQGLPGPVGGHMQPQMPGMSYVPGYGYLPQAAHPMPEGPIAGARASGWTGSMGPRTAEAMFGRAQHDLAHQRTTAYQLGFHGMAGSMVRTQQTAEGLGNLGMARGGAMVSRMAIPLAIGKAAIDTGATIADYAHDRYQTPNTTARGLVRDLVPGGEWAQNRFDRISGRSALMTRMHEDQEFSLSKIHTKSEIEATRHHYGSIDVARKSRSEVLDRATAVTMPHVNQATATGKIEFEQQQRLLPLRQQSARAEREAAICSKERVAAEGRLLNLSREGNMLTEERGNLEKRYRSADSVVQEVHIMNLMEQNEKRSQANNRLRQEASQDLGRYREQEANATAESRHANLNVKQEEAAFTRDKAQRAASTAQRLGMMTEIEQKMGLKALEHVRDRGTDMVPPQILAMAQQIAPLYVQSSAEQRGAKGDVYRQLRSISPADVPGDLNELRRKSTDQQNEVEEERLKVEKDLAAAVKQFTGPLVDTLVKLLAEAGRSAAVELEKKFRSQRVN